jgi:ABC-type uncharacterized transport system, periplasmic component
MVPIANNERSQVALIVSDGVCKLFSIRSFKGGITTRFEKKQIMAIAIVSVMVVAAAGLYFLWPDEKTGTKNADTEFGEMNWGDVIAEARGQTVNFYMWGGSSEINDFIDNQVADEAAKYGVKLNRVPLDGLDIRNKVINEINSGKTSGGSVDIAWLNGANFKALVEGDYLFGDDWALQVPNTLLVDWSNESIASDMGTPVDGYESPWGTAQFQLIYNKPSSGTASTVVPLSNGSEVPTDFIELMEWVTLNTGRFTYAAPVGGDNFSGVAFIKSVMYELDNDGAGGYKLYDKTAPSNAAWLGLEGWERFTEDGPFATINDKYWNGTSAEKAQALADFKDLTAYVWKYLQDMDSKLYKSGGEFISKAATDAAVKNGVINFTYTYSSSGTSAAINAGILPSGAKPIPMKTGLADTNYVLIPGNASSKAGAMVVANILLQPDMQALWMSLCGSGIAVSLDKMTEPMLAEFNANADRLPGTYLTGEQIAASSAPDVSGWAFPMIADVWSGIFAA